MYNRFIAATVAELGYETLDPRHVEAYIRLVHPTLDGLSATAFRAEVAIACQCVIDDGIDNAESCARSFGL